MAGLALTGTRSVVVGSPNAALRPAPGRAPPRCSFEFVTDSNYRAGLPCANHVFLTTPQNLEFKTRQKKSDRPAHALHSAGLG